jgi:hypothetical protein
MSGLEEKSLLERRANKLTLSKVDGLPKINTAQNAKDRLGGSLTCK